MRELVNVKISIIYLVDQRSVENGGCLVGKNLIFVPTVRNVNVDMHTTSTILPLPHVDAALVAADVQHGIPLSSA